MPPTTLRLADVRRPRDKVVLADGREVEVVPLNGIMHDLLKTLQSGDGEVLWLVAHAALPSLSLEEVKALELEEAEAVVTLASNPAKALEDLRKNGQPPEGTAAPASSSDSTSPTS